MNRSLRDSNLSLNFNDRFSWKTLSKGDHTFTDVLTHIEYRLYSSKLLSDDNEAHLLTLEPRSM